MTAARNEIAAAVDEALSGEAQRNERRVGIVRLWAMVLVLLLDVLLATQGIRPWSNVPFSAGWLTASLVLYGLISRVRFRSWFPPVAPVFDAVLLDRLLSQRI